MASFNEFPWGNMHGFNLDWVIEKTKQCVEKVAELETEIVAISETYETKRNITDDRKLSIAGDFTGTWNGASYPTTDARITSNRDEIMFLNAQFSDGQTGLVIDGGFFEETGIKNNYNGGKF